MRARRLALLLALAALVLSVAAAAAQADVVPVTAFKRLQTAWPYPTAWLPDVPYYRYASLKVGHDRYGKTADLTFKQGAKTALWHMHALGAKARCQGLHPKAKPARKTPFGPVYSAAGHVAWACLVDSDPAGKPVTLVFEIQSTSLTAQQLAAVVASSYQHGWGHD